MINTLEDVIFRGLSQYRDRINQGITEFIKSFNQYLLNSDGTLSPGVEATNKV